MWFWILLVHSLFPTQSSVQLCLSLGYAIGPAIGGGLQEVCKRVWWGCINSGDMQEGVIRLCPWEGRRGRAWGGMQEGVIRLCLWEGRRGRAWGGMQEGVIRLCPCERAGEGVHMSFFWVWQQTGNLQYLRQWWTSLKCVAQSDWLIWQLSHL